MLVFIAQSASLKHAAVLVRTNYHWQFVSNGIATTQVTSMLTLPAQDIA